MPVEWRNKTNEIFLVKVDEGEGKRDVQRLFFGGVSGSFSRLERDHQVDPASRTFLLEGVDELGREHVFQQAFKLVVDS